MLVVRVRDRDGRVVCMLLPSLLSSGWATRRLIVFSPASTASQVRAAVALFEAVWTWGPLLGIPLAACTAGALILAGVAPPAAALVAAALTTCLAASILVPVGVVSRPARRMAGHRIVRAAEVARLVEPVIAARDGGPALDAAWHELWCAARR